MKVQKTGFSMGRIIAGSVTLFAILVITSLASAELAKAAGQSEMVCEPILDWQALSESLQTRIDSLEAKGVERLTDDEFEHYAQLTDGLIAVKKLHTLQTTLLIKAEKKKQAKLDKVIATERAETADVKKTDQKIKELEGLLSGE